jgi:PEP-CTERM motif
MRQSTQRLAAALILATASVLATGPARAGAIININQVGTDVVVTGSGTLDTTGLTIVALNFDAVPDLTPNLGFAILGPANGSGAGVGVDEYAGATGPASFGPGGQTNPSSGSGDPFGLAFQGQFQGEILVPRGYSGAPLSATDTYANATFSSLGLTPGTYIYTLPNDTLMVQIGVPEPSTLVSAAVAVLAGVGILWRRRRRRAG